MPPLPDSFWKDEPKPPPPKPEGAIVVSNEEPTWLNCNPEQIQLFITRELSQGIEDFFIQAAEREARKAEQKEARKPKRVGPPPFQMADRKHKWCRGGLYAK